MKLLKENSHIALTNMFSDLSPWLRRTTTTKINKRDHITLKSFCTAKGTINKQKDSLLSGRIYSPTIHLIRIWRGRHSTHSPCFPFHF